MQIGIVVLGAVVSAIGALMPDSEKPSNENQSLTKSMDESNVQPDPEVKPKPVETDGGDSIDQNEENENGNPD